MQRLHGALTEAEVAEALRLAEALQGLAGLAVGNLHSLSKASPSSARLGEVLPDPAACSRRLALAARSPRALATRRDDPAPREAPSRVVDPQLERLPGHERRGRR